MAARYDFEEALWRGDDNAIPIKLGDEGAGTDPEAEWLDIRGARIIFTLKLDPTVSDDEANLIYTADIAEDDVHGEFGEHLIVLEKEATADLIIAKYTYQVILEIPNAQDGDFDHITIMWGRVPLKDS